MKPSTCLQPSRLDKDRRPSRISGSAALRNAAALGSLAGATLATAAGADVLIDHHGTADPATEGWLETPGAGGVTVGPFTGGVPPASAWFINDTSSDPSSGHNYSRQLTPCELSLATMNGWTMRTCLDVVDDDGLPSIYFGFDTTTKRYDMWFTREGGAFTVWLGEERASGCAPHGQEFTIGTAGSCHVPGFHLVELKYDPVPGSATFAVDGVVLDPAFDGYDWPGGAVPNVAFAAGSSCDDGEGRFHSVEFELNAVVSPAEVVRLGIPPNVDALHPGATTAPAVGKTWDPFVDESAMPPGTVLVDLLAIGLTPTNIPSGFGTILCGLTPPLVLVVPPGSDFSLPIPDVCTHVGKALCAQAGVVYSTGALLLTNAIDFTIGSQ